MPIYEYACTHCEHAFDELQRISEAALVNCPKCGEPALRKLLSAPKFRLKGQGWYETDFKTGNKRNLHGEADTGGKSGGKSGDKAAKKADAKPAGKTETKSTSDSKAGTP